VVTVSPAWGAAGRDWPKYLNDLGSTGFTTENLITPTNASGLRLQSGWPVHGGGAISTQPVVAHNLVFWGSWDGYEHATPLPGRGGIGWATNLGQNSTSTCSPGAIGAASTGAIASVTPAGQTTPRSVLFVGGGGNSAAGGDQAQLYALDALTGSVLWRTPLGRSPAHFLWSSPAVYTYTNTSGETATSVYIGVASLGDCPLVQGQVVQVDAASGQIQHVFNMVPTGCTGGGVWGSPSIDQSDGSLYVATGNGGKCSSAQPYAVALLKLRAPDLSLLSSWQVPAGEQATDGDFGSAPTLFSGTVTHGGKPRSLVGVPNKNGIYYVFDRSQIGAGPVARLRLAVEGDCPQCGQGSITTGVWDGTTLYLAGGSTTIGGIAYRGSVRAWNPDEMTTPLWQAGLPDGPVLGAMAGAPGLLAVGEGSYSEVLNASNGKVLLRKPVNSITGKTPAKFYGAPSVAYGTVFEGDTNGYLYAYGATPVGAVTGVMGSGGHMYVQAPQLLSGWHNLGGTLLATPAVAAVPARSPGTYAKPLFVAVGGDHALWIRGLAAGWQKLASAYCLDNPAASVSAATLYVACEGSDHSLWYGETTLPASGLPHVDALQSLGGRLSAGPAIAPVGGIVTFFVSGSDYKLATRTLASGWTSDGISCYGHPAAGTAQGANTTYAACEGSGGHVYVMTNNGFGWSAATDYGGTVTGGPGVAVTSGGAVVVWGEAPPCGTRMCPGAGHRQGSAA
jgi:outer membrane protein assembly factor BamB